MQKDRHEKLSALIDKWSGAYEIVTVRGVRCWIRGARGKVTRQGIHFRRLKNFYERVHAE